MVLLALDLCERWKGQQLATLTPRTAAGHPLTQSLLRPLMVCRWTRSSPRLQSPSTPEKIPTASLLFLKLSAPHNLAWAGAGRTTGFLPHRPRGLVWLLQTYKHNALAQF